MTCQVQSASQGLSNGPGTRQTSTVRVLEARRQVKTASPEGELRDGGTDTLPGDDSGGRDLGPGQVKVRASGSGWPHR